MKKWNLRVGMLLVLKLGLLTGTMTSLAGAQEFEESGGPVSTRRVFGDLMKDPNLHQIYLEQQLKSLTHPVDLELRKFFFADPRLRQIYFEILENQESFLTDFEHFAETGMYQLTRGVTNAYNKLDHIVEDTARDLGFSPEAIANRRIYIKDGSGSLNAFTVSGSQNKIIVVVHSDLLQKMDESEVRAVLGHEMGHIRASHPVIGYLLDSMYTIILRTFTQGHIGIPVADESSIVANFAKFCIDDKDAVRGEQRSSYGTDYVDNLLGSKFRAKRVSAFESMMKGVVQVMLSIPEPERVALLQEFLNLNLRILKVMNAPKHSIEFFTELAAKLPKAGVVKVDKAQMKEELSVLADAISQSAEMSADRFASAGSKKASVASSMGKLLGLAFTNENREGVLKALVAQAEKFYQNVSEQDRAEYMGGSHPAPVLRTQIIMNLPSTPDIFFANPFIRLLILQEGVINQVHALGQLVALPELEANVREQFKKQVEEIVGAQSELDARIVDQLLTAESRIRVGSRNPRFDNMLQFFLVKKELYFEAFHAIAESMEEPEIKKSSEKLNSLSKQKEFVEKTLANFGLPLMEQVKKALKAMESKGGLSQGKLQDLQLRQKQLEMAMSSPKTLTEVQALRSLRVELTSLPDNRNKGSRIPIECRHFTY